MDVEAIVQQVQASLPDADVSFDSEQDSVNGWSPWLP